jgi:hypothetical protein
MAGAMRSSMHTRGLWLDGDFLRFICRVETVRSRQRVVCKDCEAVTFLMSSM